MGPLFAGEVPLFFVGFFGSLAVEVVAGLRECSELDGSCPPRYKKAAFLILRTMLAIVGGILPLALDAQNVQTALFIGASAPVLLDKLQRGATTDVNGSNGVSKTHT